MNKGFSIDTLPGGFYIYRADEKKEILKYNKTVLDIYGCKNHEEFVQLTGNSFKGMVHKDDLLDVEKSIENQLSHNKKQIDYVEYRIVRKNGSIIKVSDYGRLVHTQEYGDVFYVFIDLIKKDLNPTKNLRLKRNILIQTFFAVAILLLITLYTSFSQKSIKDFAQFSIQQSCDNITTNIDSTLKYALSSIQVVSNTVAQQYFSLDDNQIANVLPSLKKKTPFSSIKYLRKDGMCFQEGKASKSEKNSTYFRNAMKGYTGVYVDFDDDNKEQSVLKFYTPLYNDNKISGVICGCLNGNTDLLNLINESFFQKKMETILCDENNNVIASSFKYIPGENLSNLLTNIGVSENQHSSFFKLLYNQESGIFHYVKDRNYAVACISTINSTGWSIIQIVPSYSLKTVFDDLNVKTLSIIIAVVLIFVIYMIYINNQNKKKNEKILKQNKLLENENNVYSVRNEENTEALKKALEKANKANQAKTIFLSSMSHDIRTPMNAIIGFTEIAQKHIENKEKVSDCLNKIHNSSDHLLNLINDVLDMSRIDSGKVELEENKTDLLKIINDVKTIMQIKMEEKGIRFNITTDSIKDNFVLCDQLRIKQIILNLLSNAYKFTPNGGCVDLCISQTDSVNNEKTVYKLVVEDSGIGMEPQFLEKIFEPFERERTSTVSKVQGTGLGMSIVKRLVDMMHGKIEVKSEKDIGSTFTIYLPFKIIEEIEDHQSSSNIEIQSLKGKQLLLVEDNELNREIAHEILSEYGFLVDMAEDGNVAIEKITKAKSHFYDVILMDIQMPILDGYETTKKIRAMDDVEKARIPIIAMTANAFEEDKKKSLQAGMNGHISKPINIENMINTLVKVL